VKGSALLRTESSTHTIVVKESVCDDEDDLEDDLLMECQDLGATDQFNSTTVPLGDRHSSVPALYEEMI
jgi:chromosome segregation ATPase